MVLWGVGRQLFHSSTHSVAATFRVTISNVIRDGGDGDGDMLLGCSQLFLTTNNYRVNVSCAPAQQGD